MPTDALPRTCRLWLWPGQAVYTGPALDLTSHSGSVACLALALDGGFTVETSAGITPPVRSALIAPRQVHRLRADSARMRFCYLDPSTARLAACAASMRAGDAAVRTGHRREDDLISLDARPAEWLDMAAPPGPTVQDPRIRAAARRLLDDPSLTAAEAARRCGLSTSRFLRLFAAHTGTTFRRYRLWARMLLAARAIAERATLTDAAAEAGFASPSHFSDAFARMFGLRPSRLPALDITVMPPAAPR
ncbi:helix-turn-helix domain-containing protein [Actinomadura kijaniata]|uniref:AraC-like DNA-binding protein n=1 Tax=Actinomadura namibiensis TaxID=182080 RepID=A0A7W3LXG1_ACTNM|nr:AraC family transcriptional regulator [Actinomadura namibiensis]MBA8956120.1 AraC-like DNA-binding protein [Actinomadura namibiensis]